MHDHRRRDDLTSLDSYSLLLCWMTAQSNSLQSPLALCDHLYCPFMQPNSWYSCSHLHEWSQRKLEATEKPSYSYSLDRGLKWREKDAFTNSIGLLWMYSYYSTDILTTSRAYTSTESFTDFIFHSVTESSSALSYDTINDTSSSMYHFMLQQFQHLSVYPFIFFVPVVVRYLIQCIFA